MERPRGGGRALLIDTRGGVARERRRRSHAGRLLPNNPGRVRRRVVKAKGGPSPPPLSLSLSRSVSRRVTAPSCFSRGRVNDGAGAINTISFRPTRDSTFSERIPNSFGAERDTWRARTRGQGADSARLGVSSFHGFEISTASRKERYVHTRRVSRPLRFSAPFIARFYDSQMIS